MTLNERAEKIRLFLAGTCGADMPQTEVADNFIIAEIRAAVEEHYGQSNIRQLLTVAQNAKADAYADAVSLIRTLLQKCEPNSDQRNALERAVAVIQARAAEVCK